MEVRGPLNRIYHIRKRTFGKDETVTIVIEVTTPSLFGVFV